MEAEKLICPSAKVPADPVILSVNEALASSPPTPSPIFLALLGGDRPTPSRRLCPEVRGCVAKNRHAGAMRNLQTCSPHVLVPEMGRALVPPEPSLGPSDASPGPIYPPTPQLRSAHLTLSAALHLCHETDLNTGLLHMTFICPAGPEKLKCKPHSMSKASSGSERASRSCCTVSLCPRTVGLLGAAAEHTPYTGIARPSPAGY